MTSWCSFDGRTRSTIYVFDSNRIGFLLIWCYCTWSNVKRRQSVKDDLNAILGALEAPAKVSS